MRVIQLDSSTASMALLQKIGSTQEGNLIMKDKMETKLFYIKDLKSPAANILKQDALSIGAELAVEKDTILCKDKTVDAVLIANEKQLKLLCKKEKAQPFGLKILSEMLKTHLKSHHFPTEIMGIINANEDSFYARSRFLGDIAIEKIEKQIEEGASIIDVGAVSSRPGSIGVAEEVELERLKPIIDRIYAQKLYERITFSLDSYSPLALKYALDRGFTMINDITGLADDRVAKLAAEYDTKVVIMHMQGTPMDMQKEPKYENVILSVEDFFKVRLEKAALFGIKEVILDVGIGFGKTLEQNLLLIKHLSHFQKFGLPLLIGASRKSLIDKIAQASVEERLAGTLALHLKAVEEGANIVRCHDVKEHVQALKVAKALQGVVI